MLVEWEDDAEHGGLRRASGGSTETEGTCPLNTREEEHSWQGNSKCQGPVG